MESCDDWPLFDGLDVSDVRALTVAMPPYNAPEDLRRACQALLDLPRVRAMLDTRKVLLLAQTEHSRAFYNRLGPLLAQRQGLWGSQFYAPIPDGHRHEFGDADDDTHFYGFLEVASGSELQAIEFSLDNFALCVAAPSTSSGKELARAFAQSRDAYEAMRWAVQLIRDDVIIFRPWDWMHDKDSGVELWGSMTEVTA